MTFDKKRAAGALTRGAYFTAYAALPVFAVFSGGTATTFLALATVLLLAGTGAAAKPIGELRAIAGSVPGNPALTLALIFIALAWLSLLWSPWPAETARFSAHITGVLGLSLLWHRNCAAHDAELARRMMYLGIAVASAILLLALFQIFNLRLLLLNDHKPSPFNRGILITCTFAASAVALAIGARQRRRSAWALFALVALVALLSRSETSKLFVVAFVLLLALFTFLERYCGRLSALVPPLIYVAFPLLVIPLRGPLEAAMDTWLRPLMVSASALARQEIWASFLGAALQRPILGWGLGTERFVPLAGNTFEAGAAARWTHPHSLPIQVLANLGITGFLIAGGVIVAMSLAIGRFGHNRPPAFALATALLVAWSVSHGAWQDWWLSAMALTMAPLFIQERAARPGNASGSRRFSKD